MTSASSAPAPDRRPSPRRSSTDCRGASALATFGSGGSTTNRTKRPADTSGRTRQARLLSPTHGTWFADAVGCRMSVATLLGITVAFVFAAGLVAAVTKHPGHARSAARPPTSTPVATPTPSTPTPSLTPTPAPTRSHKKPPAHVLGKTAHRSPGDAEELAFSGPPPIEPTLALGVLLVVAGCWLLALRPAVPVAGYDATFTRSSPTGVRRPRSAGAIDRLRSP